MLPDLYLRAGAFDGAGTGAVTRSLAEALAARPARTVARPVAESPGTAQGRAVAGSLTLPPADALATAGTGAVTRSLAETSAHCLAALTAWGAGSEIAAASFDLLEPGLFLGGEGLGISFRPEFLHQGLQGGHVVRALFSGHGLARPRLVPERADGVGVLGQETWGGAAEQCCGDDGFDDNDRFHNSSWMFVFSFSLRGDPLLPFPYIETSGR